MRRVMTVVLPVPAPAMISSGPAACVTATRWGASRPSRIRSTPRGSRSTRGSYTSVVGGGAPTDDPWYPREEPGSWLAADLGVVGGHQLHELGERHEGDVP